MTLCPRWLWDGSTDPLSDPNYAHGVFIVYNSDEDRLEMGSDQAVEPPVTEILNEYIRVLPVTNTFGLLRTNLNIFANGNISGSGKIYIKVFGYYFVWAQGHAGPEPQFVVLPEESISWFGMSLDASSSKETLSARGVLYKSSSTQTGEQEIEIQADSVSTRLYVNNVLQVEMPPRMSSSPLELGCAAKAESDERPELFVYDIFVQSDSSLPLAPTILTPSLLESATGPLEVQVPAARLFVDLTAYSNIAQVENVIYDPAGDNISMAEDADGQTGDFYLEIPTVNPLSVSKKLVLKESFVTDNSVTAGQTIRLDVLPFGPTTEDLLIEEEEGLHCAIEMDFNEQKFYRDFHTVLPGAANFAFHNTNADDNGEFMSSSPTLLVNDQYGAATALIYEDGFSFPIILDIDMLKRRHVTGMILVSPGNNPAAVESVDIYYSNTPFSGPSLGQGTLVEEAYAIKHVASSIAPYDPGGVIYSPFPSLAFTARYLRLVVNAENADYTSGDLRFGNQIYIQENNFLSINSEDDNGQFEFDDGGGYDVFPAEGVPQSGGTVRVTLPANMQLPASGTAFINARFRKPSA